MLILLPFQALYVFCLCYAVVSDFRRLVIPNWIPLALVAAFVLLAPFRMDFSAILVHVCLAAAALLLMVALFAAGWIAGGDVKLLTAVMLWMGPHSAAPFVVLMAVFGSLLALTLLGLAKYGFLVHHYARKNWLLDRLTTLADNGECPYGVAIGLAALATVNGVLWP